MRKITFDTAAKSANHIPAGCVYFKFTHVREKREELNRRARTITIGFPPKTPGLGRAQLRELHLLHFRILRMAVALIVLAARVEVGGRHLSPHEMAEALSLVAPLVKKMGEQSIKIEARLTELGGKQWMESA